MPQKNHILPLLLTVFFCWNSFFLDASKLDSLKNISPKNVNERISKFSNIGWEFRTSNLDSAFYWTLKANKLIHKKIDKSIATFNYHVLGMLYTMRGEYEDSFKWLYKAYLFRKKNGNKEDLLTTILNLVYTCQGQGDVQTMHKLALEGEKLCIELNKQGTRDHLTVLCQLSDVFFTLKRFEKSENYLKQAVIAAEKGTSDYNTAVVYHNYGTYLLKLLKFKQAMVYFEKAIALVKKINDKVWLYDLEFNLGIVYAETGFLDKAEAIFKSSYDLEINKSTMNRDSYSISVASKNVGYVAMKKKEYKKGLKFFEESLRNAKEAGAYNLLADRYMSVSEALEALKKYPQALLYRKKYEDLRDSIFNIETAKQLNELSEKFETEKKEKSILLLSKRNADIKVKQLESKKALVDEKAKSTRRNILFVSMFFIVLLIAGFIYYSLVQKRKAHLKLEEKNHKIEIQHELLEEKQKEIIDSINYAKRIQQSLLPSNKYINKNFKRLNDGKK